MKWASIPPQACPRRLSWYKYLHCSLSFLPLLLLLPFLCLSLFDTCVSILFSMHLLFLIYLYLYHIPTIHSHLTSLLSWHLLLLILEKDGGRNLVNYDFQCSGHFFINAANKIVTHRLMRMQQAILDQKLP